jgi:hypothetical protein
MVALRFLACGELVKFPKPIVYNNKSDIRTEYRSQESERANLAPSLAERFPTLKNLTVNLAFFDGGSARQSTEIKYTVNLAHARSVFRVNCTNSECVRGDFDLSAELARAVSARIKNATGELRCEGWRSKTTIDSARCANLLRFKLTLAY